MGNRSAPEQSSRQLRLEPRMCGANRQKRCGAIQRAMVLPYPKDHELAGDRCTNAPMKRLSRS